MRAPFERTQPPILAPHPAPLHTHTHCLPSPKAPSASPLPWPIQPCPPGPEHKTLQVEDVLNVIELERPEGIIVQFGGQTPLKLAGALDAALKKNPIPCASGEHPATAPTHAHQGRRCVLV